VKKVGDINKWEKREEGGGKDGGGLDGVRGAK